MSKYRKIHMLNRLQRITDQDTFSMTLSGQWAGNNLNSSEKYSLGGVYGVRAYPQGEASGDMGSTLKLELAHNFIPQLRGYCFMIMATSGLTDIFSL